VCINLCIILLIFIISPSSLSANTNIENPFFSQIELSKNRNLPPPPPDGNPPPPPPGTEPTPEPGTEPSPEPTPEPGTEPSPVPMPEPGTEPPPESTSDSESMPPPPPPTDIHNLTPDELEQLTAEQGSGITPEQGGSLTPEQVGHIPPEAIGGFPADTLLAMPPDTVKSLTPEQIKSINSEEFQKSEDDDVGKFFINLDPEKITPEDAKDLLPPGWTIDSDTGELIAPVDTQLSLPNLESGSTPGFNPPENIPDLSKSFSLGGENGTSFLDKANQTLSGAGLSQFKFKQDSNSGKINFDNSETNSKYALAADANGIFQSDSSSEPGLEKNNEGFFVLTTDDNQQLILRPIPADPAALGIALNGDVHLGEKGNVLINGGNTAISALFGSEIQQAPDGTPPGPLVQSDGSVLYVFDDGQAQSVFPTPNEPDLLIALLLAQIDGLSNLSYNSDGTLSGFYNGKPVIIQTSYNADVKSVDSGVDNSAGSLAFSQIENDGSLVLLYRSPIPETDSTSRARVSDSDVEQRISIKYDDSEEESTTDICLDSTDKPSNFIGFIETMTSCKFIVY